MCPGGQVVAAASEEGGVVVNGMSCYARDGRNANSAVCVSVRPEDHGGTPESAISFQRTLEKNAYVAGGGDYSAPIQTVGDFLNEVHGSAPGVVEPTYRNGHVRLASMDDILPPFVCLPYLARKIAEYKKRPEPSVRVLSSGIFLKGSDRTGLGMDLIFIFKTVMMEGHFVFRHTVIQVIFALGSGLGLLLFQTAALDFCCFGPLDGGLQHFFLVQLMPEAVSDALQLRYFLLNPGN
jgi:hypothetical protein